MWWRLQALLLWWCAVSWTAAHAQAPTNPLQAKCEDDFAKLTDCMEYATGHAGAPSSPCCLDAEATQGARPECLCHIIQQVRGGRNRVQSLGLRFDRLLALPAACNLASANATLCINLLHLTPSSPDYALFANASKTTPSSTDTNTPRAAAAAASHSTAAGYKLRTTGVRGGSAIVVAAVLSSIIFF